MAKAEKYRLAQIVERFGGEILGNPQTPISQVATLESAGAEHISFLTQGKYRKQLAGTRAGAVILGKADSGLTDLPRIVCDEPYLYFAKVSALFNPPQAIKPGVHRTAIVERGARIPASASIGAGAYVGRRVKLGKGVVIGPGCHIGDGVEIGAACRLHARVTIYPECRLGQRALVHSGAVIGADGFGIAQDHGVWRNIPQVGRVLIGDDVEIGANTCIDRGALDDTVVEDGVKLDNLIQIGHNVHIGAHTAIAGCTGIAGSSRIGKHCMIGGAVAIVGHLDIADRVIIHAAAVVTKSIRKAGTYGGHPAEDSLSWARHVALLRHLDSLCERLRNIEQRLSTPENKA
ncbi:MAG: UDP-3-O-(3-hydroxymyristoyl)glucosamine N-acyltransferase [Betaproteobacteria bacterium RIFCSPLOWO2_12_FULL_62_13b]|nr:MAG: UDP-3-O-(3-hydroxymyristoyl)glucosamine N-acyltransferase [Betaproteobacteria bacterium RIFCSPLOWO2_12_FULL_62_13b]